MNTIWHDATSHQYHPGVAGDWGLTITARDGSVWSFFSEGSPMIAVDAPTGPPVNGVAGEHYVTLEQAQALVVAARRMVEELT